MPDSIDDVLAAIASQEHDETRRLVVAIAGPPAAGKSTLATRLRSELAPRAAVLGLDAFHFDDVVLNERGHRHRKGAPHTFDVVAYRHTLALLRERPDLDVSIPVFDRSLELARNCAEVVTSDHSILITEGNYLLLGTDPWRGLGDLFDLTIWVEPSRDEIERRILQRWADHGLGDKAARERAERNDLPNARLVVADSQPATLTLAI